ncbi:MAG: hypothetical protein WBC69_10880 [Geitlerinemataceae cyanobacterium]
MSLPIRLDEKGQLSHIREYLVLRILGAFQHNLCRNSPHRVFLAKQFRSPPKVLGVRL